MMGGVVTPRNIHFGGVSANSLSSVIFGGDEYQLDMVYDQSLVLFHIYVFIAEYWYD